MADDQIRIRSLERTCGSCPSQWEGEAEDGRHVYIRYRWGCLSLGVGGTHREAVADGAYCVEAGGPYDGTMSDERMRSLLAAVIDFGAVEGER